MTRFETLQAELTNDPTGIGYSGMTAQQAADAMNAETRTEQVSSITGDEAFQQTDETEFGALTNDQRVLWLSFCGRSEIDPWAPANVAFVKWVFGDASQTVQNLGSVRERQVSRASQLGLQTIETAWVEKARE